MKLYCGKKWDVEVGPGSAGFFCLYQHDQPDRNGYYWNFHLFVWRPSYWVWGHCRKDYYLEQWGLGPFLLIARG